MSIYEYEQEKWRELQSNYTKFLSVLDKNRNDIDNKDLYVLKLIQLNSLVDQIGGVLDEIKYECIYPQTKYKNHKKIKKEIEEHFKQKAVVNWLCIL
jgi:hypothetical protein